ncbi:hypothetical protein BJ944DRAFT_228118 [Cunninghamella echinulata]|nr:hypothetical protein BJ944DRAFT_228118 [Cunninghamella echinulata]
MYTMYHPSPVMVSTTISPFDDYVQYQLWKQRRRQEEELRQYQAYREWCLHVKRQKQLQQQQQRLASIIAASIEQQQKEKEEEERRQRLRKQKLMAAAAYQNYLQQQQQQQQQRQYYSPYYEEVRQVNKRKQQDEEMEDEEMDLVKMVNYIISNFTDQPTASKNDNYEEEKEKVSQVEKEKQEDTEMNNIHEEDTKKTNYEQQSEVEESDDEQQSEVEESDDEQQSEDEEGDDELQSEDEDEQRSEDEEDENTEMIDHKELETTEPIETIDHTDAMDTIFTTQEDLEKDSTTNGDDKEEEGEAYLLIHTDGEKDDNSLDEKKQQKLKQLKSIQEQLDTIHQSHSQVLATTLYFDGLEDTNSQHSTDTTAIQVPTISKNKTFLKYEDDIIKILLQLDNVDSEGDEGIRQERKKLVKQAEFILNELDQYKQSEWEKYSSSSHSSDDDDGDNEDDNHFLILNF